MKFLLNCPSDLADSVALLVRSFILTQFPSWRPIAYIFPDITANILTAGNSIISSPIDIHTRLVSLQHNFGEVGLGTTHTEEYSLGAGSPLVIKGETIATAVDSTTFKVVYSYNTGIHIEADNRSLVAESSGLVVFASRHTIVESLAYVIEPKGDGSSDILFSNTDSQLLEFAKTAIGKLFSI